MKSKKLTLSLFALVAVAAMAVMASVSSHSISVSDFCKADSFGGTCLLIAGVTPWSAIVLGVIGLKRRWKKGHRAA